jgi:hypothetical protein
VHEAEIQIAVFLFKTLKSDMATKELVILQN